MVAFLSREITSVMNAAFSLVGLTGALLGGIVLSIVSNRGGLACGRRDDRLLDWDDLGAFHRGSPLAVLIGAGILFCVCSAFAPRETEAGGRGLTGRRARGECAAGLRGRITGVDFQIRKMQSIIQ